MAMQHGNKVAQRVVPAGSVLAVAAAALAAVLATGPASAAESRPQAAPAQAKLTPAGALRPGMYGRVDLSRAAAPALIHPQPAQVQRDPATRAAAPVYLYVPPGQVRKWSRHCKQWQACAVPVYFVRVDDSPSKLGRWKETARPAPALSIVQAFAPRPD